MANHAREKRGNKTDRGPKNAAPPTLTVVSNITHIDNHPREPTITDPESWTPEFCFEMAAKARVDKNPLPPHVWSLRGHTIAFAAEQKKKHPFIGMPVNEHGETIATPPAAVPGDWKTELLGAIAERSEAIKHSDL